MAAVIRPARPEDVEALLRVKARSWREAYGSLLAAEVFDRVDARVPEDVPAWAALIGSDKDLWVVEADGGRLVGVALAGPSRIERPACGEPEASHASDASDAPDDGSASPSMPGRELMVLYILAETYGTGVGARLMRAAAGDGPAVLRVLAENPRAIAFYRKHGFVEDGAPQPMEGAWAGLHEQLMVRRG